uniref:Uncharacterized protein n=1 Tax=Rhizophora mucronata TaxID=61149 RepID=A0A2P2QZL2_RHIMU
MRASVGSDRNCVPICGSYLGDLSRKK